MPRRVSPKTWRPLRHSATTTSRLSFDFMRRCWFCERFLPALLCFVAARNFSIDSGSGWSSFKTPAPTWTSLIRWRCPASQARPCKTRWASISPAGWCAGCPARSISHGRISRTNAPWGQCGPGSCPCSRKTLWPKPTSHGKSGSKQPKVIDAGVHHGCWNGSQSLQSRKRRRAGSTILFAFPCAGICRTRVFHAPAIHVPSIACFITTLR